MPIPGWTATPMPAPDGITFIGPIAAARNSDGRLEAFVLAQDGDSTAVPGDIYHASQLEATNGPPELVQVGSRPLLGGGTEPLTASANGDLWSDLATPLWTSLGRPPNGGVFIDEPALQGQGGSLPQPQWVMSPVRDALGHLTLCVVGADNCLHSRTQTAPADSSSWGPWLSSPPRQTALFPILTAVASGNAIFAFLVGATAAGNEIIYFVQDGSGQPWSGPFVLGNPLPAQLISAAAATVDAAGGIILTIAIVNQPPGGDAGAALYANHLPPALNSPWSGWMALPAVPNGTPPPLFINLTWAQGTLFLIFTGFPSSAIYYLRYALPPLFGPEGSRPPAWATEYQVLAQPVDGVLTWAADSWDTPAPGVLGPLGTAVFYLNGALVMVSFVDTRPMGRDLPQLVPAPPATVDASTAWSSSPNAVILPIQAAIRNASSFWQVFFLEERQCYRWTQSAAT